MNPHWVTQSIFCWNWNRNMNFSLVNENEHSFIQIVQHWRVLLMTRELCSLKISLWSIIINKRRYWRLENTIYHIFSPFCADKLYSIYTKMHNLTHALVIHIERHCLILIYKWNFILMEFVAKILFRLRARTTHEQRCRYGVDKRGSIGPSSSIFRPQKLHVPSVWRCCLKFERHLCCFSSVFLFVRGRNWKDAITATSAFCLIIKTVNSISGHQVK